MAVITAAGKINGQKGAKNLKNHIGKLPQEKETLPFGLTFYCQGRSCDNAGRASTYKARRPIFSSSFGWEIYCRTGIIEKQAKSSKVFLFFFSRTLPRRVILSFPFPNPRCGTVSRPCHLDRPKVSTSLQDFTRSGLLKHPARPRRFGRHMEICSDVPDFVAKRRWRRSCAHSRG